jgi:hypothetical protein
VALVLYILCVALCFPLVSLFGLLLCVSSTYSPVRQIEIHKAELLVPDPTSPFEVDLKPRNINRGSHCNTNGTRCFVRSLLNYSDYCVLCSSAELYFEFSPFPNVFCNYVDIME